MSDEGNLTLSSKYQGAVRYEVAAPCGCHDLEGSETTIDGHRHVFVTVRTLCEKHAAEALAKVAE